MPRERGKPSCALSLRLAPDPSFPLIFRLPNRGFCSKVPARPERDSGNGALAQLVEHLHGMQGVSGSNPLCSTPRPVVGAVASEVILEDTRATDALTSDFLRIDRAHEFHRTVFTEGDGTASDRDVGGEGVGDVHAGLADLEDDFDRVSAGEPAFRDPGAHFARHGAAQFDFEIELPVFAVATDGASDGLTGLVVVDRSDEADVRYQIVRTRIRNTRQQHGRQPDLRHPEFFHLRESPG